MSNRLKTANRLRKSLAQNRRSLELGRASEEDVVNHLVAPVLDYLGYTAATTRHQYHIGRRKADAALWPNEDAMRRQPPAVILEAKKLDANFDVGPSLASTPLRQIEGYMVSAESRGDVLGVLTDGVRWRVLRRVFHSLWWRRIGRGSYHERLVRFLFHDRLNKRRNRPKHSVEEVQEALRSVRYLNGSLFAQQDGDSALTLSDADYFGHEEGCEGLWTIFATHRWTTQEEDAEVREQSVDPKMLGGLFENLMATVETGSTANLLERLPGGTYYTPVDLVASAAWTHQGRSVRRRHSPFEDVGNACGCRQAAAARTQHGVQTTAANRGRQDMALIGCLFYGAMRHSEVLCALGVRPGPQGDGTGLVEVMASARPASLPVRTQERRRSELASHGKVAVRPSPALSERSLGYRLLASTSHT